MKRLSTVIALLAIISSAAVAHEGSLGLYTSQAATDCDATFVPFVAQNVYMMYFRSDAGPDGITAAEFQIDYPAGSVILQAPAWSPSVAVTLGDLTTGMAVSFAGCTGAGQQYVYIGYVPVMSLAPVPFTLRIVVSSQVVDPPFTPTVAVCPDPRPLVTVLGGYFSSPDGTCNVATQETSWGAIKGMYR